MHIAKIANLKRFIGLVRPHRAVAMHPIRHLLPMFVAGIKRGSRLTILMIIPTISNLYHTYQWPQGSPSSSCSHSSRWRPPSRSSAARSSWLSTAAQRTSRSSRSTKHSSTSPTSRSWRGSRWTWTTTATTRPKRPTLSTPSRRGSTCTSATPTMKWPTPCPSNRERPPSSSNSHRY